MLFTNTHNFCIYIDCWAHLLIGCITKFTTDNLYLFGL